MSLEPDGTEKNLLELGCYPLEEGKFYHSAHCTCDDGVDEVMQEMN